MGAINFDAQRAEAGVEGHTIIVGGRDVELPAILSLDFGAAMAKGDIAAAVEVLVTDADDIVDTELARHLMKNLDIDDLNQIAEDLYGLTDPTGADAGPNRAARRAGQKGKGKKTGGRG